MIYDATCTAIILIMRKHESQRSKQSFDLQCCQQKMSQVAAKVAKNRGKHDPKVAQFLDEPTRPEKHPNWAFFY